MTVLEVLFRWLHFQSSSQDELLEPHGEEERGDAARLDEATRYQVMIPPKRIMT
jgi:hypothetical protein